MSKFCTHCGNEIADNAVFCVKCGCSATPIQSSQNNTTPRKQTQVASILGIVGIIFAFLLAILGHIISITGIVMGIKEYKETEKITGLTLSIIGEVCSIFSSIIGAVTMTTLLY